MEKSLKSSVQSSKSENDNLDQGLLGGTAQQMYHGGAAGALEPCLRITAFEVLSPLCSSQARGGSLPLHFLPQSTDLTVWRQ